MKEFVMLYRADQSSAPQFTPEQAQEMTQRWMDWISNIHKKGNLVDRGNRLVPDAGRTIKSDIVTNGPYAEIKETIRGYSIIKANSLDEVVEIAKGCPGLTIGGSVEIREISKLS